MASTPAQRFSLWVGYGDLESPPSSAHISDMRRSHFLGSPHPTTGLCPGLWGTRLETESVLHPNSLKIWTPLPLGPTATRARIL